MPLKSGKGWGARQFCLFLGACCGMIFTRKYYTKRRTVMAELSLKPGKVYRTEDLVRYDKNPTRLAARLVRAGSLRRLRKGVYYAPRPTVFGEAPPTEADFLKSFFRGRPYLRTGPSVWNALGMGTTAVEAIPLVYNTTRSGIVQVGGRRFELRRVRFPREVHPEYLVVDLLENVNRAGVSVETVRRSLKAAVKAGRFNAEWLQAMASKYGTRATQGIVQDALHESATGAR